MAHWEMQGWMILLLGWLFVPFYQLLNNKMGKIITMPDFLKYRYTQRTDVYKRQGWHRMHGRLLLHSWHCGHVPSFLSSR